VKAKSRQRSANDALRRAKRCDLERPSNRAAAAKWYRTAALAGNVEAQNLLAELLRDHVATREAEREAVAWFRKAAKGGDVDAQLSPGPRSSGIRRDRSQALRWYRRASRNGHSGAKLTIGHMYREGHCVPQSWGRAIMETLET